MQKRLSIYQINEDRKKKDNRLIIFVWFDYFCPSQQYFSHVGTGLPGLNQHSAADKVSCSRVQHSAYARLPAVIDHFVYNDMT